MSFDPFGAIGSVISGWFGYKGQKDTNRMNYDIAQQTNAQNWRQFQEGQAFTAAQNAQQMAFQERMSNSAWQRGTADMKAAGINPILAATQGSASAPPGAGSGSPGGPGAVTGAPMQSPASRAVEAFNSAMNARMQIAQLRQINEVTKKVGSEIDLNRAIERNTSANSALATAKLPREQTYSQLWELPSNVIKKVKSLDAEKLINSAKGSWRTTTPAERARDREKLKQFFGFK